MSSRQLKWLVASLTMFLMMLTVVGVQLLAFNGQAKQTQQTQQTRPALGGCFGDGINSFPGCDGYLPPGKTSCPGNLYDYQTPLYDNHGIQIAILHLWNSNYSNGCGSEWGAVQATNNNEAITVQDLLVIETTADKDAYGPNLPGNVWVLKGTGPVWLSTYMTGTPSGDCAYAYVNYQDASGTYHDIYGPTKCARA